MNQYTLRDLEIAIKLLKAKLGKDFDNTTIFLGDDDELNGIHCCWHIEHIKVNSKDPDDTDIIAWAKECLPRDTELKDYILIY